MLDRGHGSIDTQALRASVNGFGGDHFASDARGGSVAADNPGGDKGNPDAHGYSVAADSLLLVYADAVDDLERTRIATANRLRSLIQVKGLKGSPEEKRMLALLDGLKQLERKATNELARAVRAHPLAPFAAARDGLGAKQFARLLAAIGDPADRPNPAKLWAYCGFHVIDGKRPRRQRGVKANWNGKAKMRAYLCAESCMKQRSSPYRVVYDRERAKWAGRDTTDLHKHNHALSVTAKAILLDLWREARRLREATPDA